MIESMFHLHLPLMEKILRPAIVYIFLILFLRLFGKSELAMVQLLQVELHALRAELANR